MRNTCRRKKSAWTQSSYYKLQRLLFKYILVSCRKTFRSHLFQHFSLSRSFFWPNCAANGFHWRGPFNLACLNIILLVFKDWGIFQPLPCRNHSPNRNQDEHQQRRPHARMAGTHHQGDPGEGGPLQHLHPGRGWQEGLRRRRRKGDHRDVAVKPRPF